MTVKSFWWTYPFITTKLCLVIFFALTYTFSGTYTTTPIFFWSVLVWHIFSHPFAFNQFVSLFFKCVYCRQHNIWLGSCSFIQSANLCLLIGVFKPFIFNMIIDIVWYNYMILLFAVYLFNLFIIPFSSFSSTLHWVLFMVLSPLLVYSL